MTDTTRRLNAMFRELYPETVEAFRQHPEWTPPESAGLFGTDPLAYTPWAPSAETGGVLTREKLESACK